MTTLDLTGKNILVTGASRGIGRAIALELAENGAKVAAHFNTKTKEAEQLLEEGKGNIQIYQANLASSTETMDLFNQVIVDFDRIDVLVNNAGIAIPSDVSGSMNQWLSDWELTMNVNLQAVGILCNQAVNHFIRQGGGSIINISSRAAFRGDTADYLAYAASKGGVVSLTRSIARAYGKKNIKAFIIAPGFVRTDMAEDFIKEYGEGFVKDDIALPDLTEPKDVAHMVTFLASGLGDHATGGTFDINAGSYVH